MCGGPDNQCSDNREALSTCEPTKSNFVAAKTGRRFGATALAALLLTSALAQVNPRQIISLDLDSLIYMGPQIVEGRFQAKNPAIKHSNSYVTVWDVSISLVHKGSFKVGQQVEVVVSDFAREEDCGFVGSDYLKAGDEFFLFLDNQPSEGTQAAFHDGKTQATFRDGLPTKSEFYWPAPSGLRLIKKGKVVFYLNEDLRPYPYHADPEGAETNATIPTVAELREQIRESLPRVETWRLLLEREAAAKNIPELVRIIREREQHKSLWRRDRIAELASERLASLHDIPSVVEAMRLGGDFHRLVKGFDTKAGREFLFSQILDGSKPEAERINWVTILGNVGLSSREHDFERVAQLAIRDEIGTDLRSALLGCLQAPYHVGVGVGGSMDGMPDKTQKADVVEACGILESFSRRTISEELKYEIDLALASLMDNEDGTNLPPVISILRSINRTDNRVKPPQGHLGFAFRYYVVRTGNWTVKVALVDVKARKKWSLNSNRILGYTPGAQGGGGDEVVLPEDLPRGRYRVFFEHLNNGKVEGSGHFFEMDL